MSSNALITSAPKIPDDCLQEGRKILSVTIDLTSPNAPIEDTAIGLPYYALDGVTKYQRVSVNLANLSNGNINLSQIKSLIFSWRPCFNSTGDGGDLSNRHTLIVYNQSSQQSVYIGDMDAYGAATAAEPLIHGALPFPMVNGQGTVDFFVVVTAGSAQGRGTFLFCNFDVAPYMKTVYDQVTAISPSVPLEPNQGGTGTIVPPADAQILVGQAGGVYAPVSVTGDVSLTDAGVSAVTKITGVLASVDGQATAGIGIPILVAVIKTTTSSTTGVPSTVIFTTVSAGVYRISFYGRITVAGAGGTYAGAFLYTDNGVAHAAVSISNTFSAATLSTNITSLNPNACIFNADATTNISIEVLATTVTGTPTLAYTFVLERLQ